MRGSRFALLDNAKALLIILVIFGHLIEPALGVNPAASAAYGAIYQFHMPAFALISGMLSDRGLDRAALARLGRKLLVPLLVFQLLYWPALALARPDWQFDPLIPNWILWFLLSLLFWRLMLPLFARLPFALILAVGLAGAAGCVDSLDRTLSLSRTFVFFPAFLAGHLYRDRILAMAQIRWPRALALLALIVAPAGLLVGGGADVTPLYGSHPYALQPIALPQAVALRLALVCAGVAASIVFLALVPRGVGRWTDLGRQTMPVFLLHGLVVLALAAANADRVFVTTGGLLLAMPLSVLLAFGLARLSGKGKAALRAMRAKGQGRTRDREDPLHPRPRPAG